MHSRILKSNLYLIGLLLLTSCLNCNSQDKSVNAIEYNLSKEVAKKLSSLFANDFDPKYTILISESSENQFSFTFYDTINYSDSAFMTVYDNANKFFMIKGKKIPILNIEDFYFSSSKTSFQIHNQRTRSLVLNARGIYVKEIILPLDEAIR